MKYLDELKELNLPANDFAVFGSGPLAIRGLLDNSDIDIVVRQRLWQELIAKYPEIIAGKEIRVGNISLYKNWSPWFENNDELIDSADVIDGIRFVNLANVKEWKRAYGREKDRAHILIIDKYLNEAEK